MTALSTWSRACSCGEGLHIEDGRATTDDGHVVGRGGPCAATLASMERSATAGRWTTPRRRTESGWVDVPWDEALDAIAAELRAVRRRHGPAGLGVWAGPAVGADTDSLVRTTSLALAWGTPHFYGPLSSRGGAAWARACELVLGHPCTLLGDIGRAHYVLLLGSNQEAQGWGPLQGGRYHTQDLAFSRRTKGTKLVVVDPRRTPTAAGADLHLRPRPGTELFVVLGLVAAVLEGGWYDKQYVRDYCGAAGGDAIARLREVLAPWPLERCAEVCGIPASDLGGVALKFARAPMAVAHRSPQALSGPQGTLTAWAVLVLHALTANLLRPGGLFDARGAVDLHPLLRAVPTAASPRTHGGWALQWLQAPGAALPDDVVGEGSGAVRALLCVNGDPAGDLPGPDRAALDALDLIVALDTADSPTSARAHWTLPVLHPWETSGARLHEGAELTVRHAQRTGPVRAGPSGARPVTEVLAELHRRVGAVIRGGSHGAHLRAAGAWLATADLGAVERRALDLLGAATNLDAAALDAPGGWSGGEVDRATWRVGTPDGRLDLVPVEIGEALRALRAPAVADAARWPGRLLASATRHAALQRIDRPDEDPGVSLHPAWGFAAGEWVHVRTEHGSITTHVTLDETLPEDVVDCPVDHVADVRVLLGAGSRDPMSGVLALDGWPCAVVAASAGASRPDA